MIYTDDEMSIWTVEALKASFIATDLIQAAINGQKHFSTKENQTDLVTETDKAVESSVLNHLKSKFPGHIFVGEESAVKIGELSNEPTWVIDPIDGTTNFVHSFPFFCISIGLCVNKEPVVGVIYNPMLKELYFASKGRGAFLLENSAIQDFIENIDSNMQLVGGRRLCCRGGPTALSQALICTEYGASKSPSHLLPKIDMIRKLIMDPVGARGIRSIGSAAISMSMVAAGVVDLYYEAGTHAWDVCAGVIIVRESGGIVCGFENTGFDVLERKVVCSRHEELISEFKQSVMIDIDLDRD